MKRRKALSLLLILTILLSLVLPATSALADDDTSGGDKTKGMSISKTASYDDVTKKYTITLEAFATGEKITSVVSQDVPTDIVLVIDQSSSMTDPIGTVSFSQYTGSDARNANLYDNRHNGGSGNLWYQLEDGKYVSVSVTKKEYPTCTEITNGRNNQSREYDYGNWEWIYYTNLYENSNNLYAKLNGEYVKVTVTEDGDGYYSTYTYTLPDGTVIASGGYSYDTPTITGTDDSKLYLATAINADKATYTYTYTDASGNAHTIGTSTGASNTNFDNNTKITLYQRTVNAKGGGTRLAAIKAAVTDFANAVHEKAKGIDRQFGTADDVKHRIAMVGFATGDYASSGYSTYENTELFIGSAEHNYSTDASSYYASAFQDMSTQEGYNNVLASKDALAASGATRTDLGIRMANEIFKANPLQPTEKRNRIMIVFTDGVPSRWNGYNSTVAGNAISYANTAKTPIKDGGYGATVYGIGIFSGADATKAGSTGQDSTDADKGNYFLQNVSSNNGTPQSRSYYLSAGDMGTLSSIFQQISGNIESGGSSTTLGSETVVKDIISPYFKLPEGANKDSIRLTTYDCTAKTGDTYTWGNPQDAKNSGVTADVNGNQVSVTGFNFSENWCGLDKAANGDETPHGKKLVISFEVEPKSGFLGGYSVDTNGGAYIYENADAKESLMEFEKPKVDVTIPDVGVTAEDKNVYLLGEVTLDQLKSGAVVKADDGSENGIPIDLSKATDTDKPYGLEKWQTQYVDITVAVKDKDGKDVTDKIGNLTDDTTYKIIVTVSPKQGTVASGIGPEVTEKSGNATGKINVFKPELTYKDSDVYYGADAPALDSHLTDTKWKHGEGTNAKTDSQVTMIGTAPTLDKTYTPGDGIENGKINTKKDIGVDVKVEISKADAAGNTTKTDVTDKTTFVHTECEGDRDCSLDANEKFLLHVKTCTLTITKAGNVAAEPFVFTVYKDSKAYTEVTIVGAGSVTIAELPIGKYSIEEHTGWSWRYKNPAYDNNGVELNALNPTGTITCTNTKGNDQWLNDYDVVSNIYGQTHNTTTDTNN